MNNQETQGTTNDADPASVDRVVSAANDQIRLNLHYVRTYAAQLRRVAEMYEQMEQMARKPGSQLAPVLAVAGRMATSGLSQAGELLLALYPDDSSH